MVKSMRTLVLVGGLGAFLAVSGAAVAVHPRPKGATPLRVSLVPAFAPCTSPNRQHGAPLSFPSCSPPVHASNWVTVGTADANGAPANFEGFVRLDVIHSTHSGPEETEL